MGYVRIRFTDDGSPRSVILRDPVQGAVFTSGIEVDRHGDTVADHGFDQRLRLIANDLITRRAPLFMDSHYGVLTDA